MEIHSLAQLTPSSPARRYDDTRQAAVSTPQEAGSLRRDESVTDPRAIAQTHETETERPADEQDPAAAQDVAGESLSDADQRLVEQLKQRDAEVRAHELAHVAAGGGHITSGPSYSYQTGPDGKRYAIGGEVGIDTSLKSGDPEGNLEKARAIIRAAMAPAEPSSQDVRVAASARAMQARAQQEIRERQVKEYEQVMAASTTASRAATASGTPVDEASAASRGSRVDPGTTSNQGRAGGQERLAQRIAALFSAPVETGLSQLA